MAKRWILTQGLDLFRYMLFLYSAVTINYRMFQVYPNPPPTGESTSFPGSLIFPPKRERRDPGWVWSRATLTIENIREGSSCNQAICRFELCRIQSEADSIALCPPLPAMFYSSLQAAISNSI